MMKKRIKYGFLMLCFTFIALSLNQKMVGAEEQKRSSESGSLTTIKLKAETIGQKIMYDDIVFSQNKNGVFFIRIIEPIYSNNKTYQIIFYDIDHDTYENLYTVKNIEKMYIGEKAAYFAKAGESTKLDEEITEGEKVYTHKIPATVYKYEFETGEEQKISLDSMKATGNWLGYLSGLGVDEQGRIYIATNDDEIHLFQLSGKELSKANVESKCNGFYGFDKTNGNFYYKGEYNWRYWGYDHTMTSLMAGNVKNNNIDVKGQNLSMLYQSYAYEHYNPVKMLNDQYMAIYSGFNSNSVMLVDSNHYDYKDVVEQTTTIDAITNSVITSKLNIKNQELMKLDVTSAKAQYSNKKDISSIGPKCDLKYDASALIIKTGEKTLSEYDIATKKKKIEVKTEYPVYTFDMQKEKCIVIEKDGDDFYLEVIDWNYPETFDVDAPNTMKVGEAEKIVASVDSNYQLDYTYESSDSKVISVNEKGKINAWKKGKATISIKAAPIQVTKKLEIVVTDSDLSREENSYSVIKTKGQSSENIHQPESMRYGVIKTSYLHEMQQGGYERVEYLNQKILIETYDKKLNLTGKKTIEMELPLFGGFYSGSKYNYIVLGQKNEKEDNDTEVIRVIQYSKDWKKVKSCSIKGANTRIPFYVGSLDMTETKDSLYIHTCHQMYRSDDGLCHQANCTFVLDETNMDLTDSYFDVMNLSYGYVSHSFMQLIETDGEEIYRADLGDAYPRGIALSSTNVTDKIIKPSFYKNVVPIEGQIGDNRTGYSLSGLRLSDDYYMVAGNGEKANGTDVRNIFINTGLKTNWKTGATWLTDYDGEDKISVYQPQLVKITENQFLLMWEEYSQNSKKYQTKMLLLDPCGTKVSDIYVTPLALSACEPIVNTEGKVIWYSTNKESPIFEEINPYQLEKVQENSKKETIFDSVHTDSNQNANGNDTSDNNTQGGIVDNKPQESQLPVKNKEKKVTSFTSKGMKYKVKEGKKVSIVGPVKKNKKNIVIASTVTYKGVKYKITSISANAFKRNGKIKKVTIGNNISRIEKNAFYKCKRLKKVVIKGKKISYMGKKSFKGLHKKVTFKLPKSEKKKYKKMLRKAGAPKNI